MKRKSFYVKIDDENGTGAVIMRNSDYGLSSADFRFQEKFRFLKGKEFARWPIGVIKDFDERLWKKGKKIKTYFVRVTKQLDETYLVLIYDKDPPIVGHPTITGYLNKIEDTDTNAILYPQYWESMYLARVLLADSKESYTLYMTDKGLVNLLSQRGKNWKSWSLSFSLKEEKTKRVRTKNHKI